MTGLILKDILCLRKVLRSYLVIFGAYALLVATGVWSVSVLLGFLSVMVSMLPFTCFNVDHAAKWDAYGLALPVSRNKIVGARYLALLLMIAMGAVIALAAGAGIWIAGRGEEEFFVTLLTGLVCLGLGSLINAPMLPLIYWFGAERARIVFFALFFGIGGLLGLWLLPMGGAQWLETIIIDTDAFYQNKFFIAAVSLLCVAVSLTLRGVSYLISCAIYRRKEM